jgi:dTDP-4-dehydrorhamnose reductase
MRRVLVLGCRGQVGAELMQARWGAAVEIVGRARPQLDIAAPHQVEDALAALSPGVVVNAAAYTAVDAAETDEAGAFAINADGPRLLAEACRRRGVPLIHLSTDYVFDGAAPRPYREDAPIRPVNAYGRSKAAGEAAVRRCQPQHVIVRTAWVYASHGSNFVRTMLRLAHEREEVRVVADQRGSPTAAADIADAIVRIVRRIAPEDGTAADAPWGTYHYAARGETTWHGVAAHIFERLERAGNRRPRLTPIATADYPSRAARPAYSCLDCGLIERTFRIAPEPWQASLDRVLDRLVPESDRLEQQTYGGAA